MSLKNFDDVDEIVQHAIDAKDIANYQAQKFSTSKWAAQKTPSLQDSKPSGPSEKVFSKPEGQNRITYFHCEQQGHRTMECPKHIHLIEVAGDVKMILRVMT